ncbi:MAG TPA: Rho termination factor N-terminal domain-containing protein, partial [Pseudonocardiaceae bacterium]|nr:Rho termination factor N-terminal domain-containing protein [Pseudonocardiaceae bacterium]
MNSDTATAETPVTPSGSDSASNGGSPRRRAGLSGMVLAELRELAGQLGITGTTGMRKGDLITAIKERQGGGQTELPVGSPRRAPSRNGQRAAKAQPAEPVVSAPAVSQPAPEKRESAPAPERDSEDAGQGRSRRRRSASRPAGSPEAAAGQREQQTEQVEQEDSGVQRHSDRQSTQQGERREQTQGDRPARRPESDRPQGNRPQGNRPAGGANPNDEDDDERGGRRGRRFRDRRRGGERNERNERGGRTRGEGGSGGDTEIREDDVLLPVGGILDVLENYAFVRTSGYLAGPNDVYVSLSLVRKYGLRRGDAVTGVVKQPREGEQQRQKFNPLVRVDKINGLDPELAKQRPEFTKMTPLYPNERLRLESEPHILTTRVIDLVMPVGKGQRALIVSPPKAGKTMVLQSIANAITTNNPECHLMVVLVDERPEEVTDMQRSVRGEVIASTFDRPPGDHT